MSHALPFLLLFCGKPQTTNVWLKPNHFRNFLFARCSRTIWLFSKHILSHRVARFLARARGGSKWWMSWFHAHKWQIDGCHRQRCVWPGGFPNATADFYHYKCALGMVLGVIGARTLLNLTTLTRISWHLLFGKPRCS